MLREKNIIVGRAFEIDEMKQTNPNDWRAYFDKINKRDGPVLVLDYSYLSLLVDKEAPVGGVFTCREKRMSNSMNR